MELTTRCPECETVFTVSMAQLQLRKGYIRCIQCAHIFDGFEAAVPAEPSQDGPRRAAAPAAVEPTLAPPLPPPVATGSAPESTSRATPTSGGGFFIPPPDQVRIDGPTPARPFSIGGGQGVRTEAAAEPQVPSVVRQRSDMRATPAAAGPSFTVSGARARQAATQRTEPGMGSDDPQADDVPFGHELDDQAGTGGALFVEPHVARRSGRHKPEFLSDRQRRRDWMAPVWAILSICGLVLLLLQGVYVYRSQLANNFPGLRPSLEAACERFGCQVPYERRIEAIAITGSALRSSGAPDGEMSNLVLEITLRNTHERPQEWPTLVLDLKDASGAIVARRNLAPEIWVPPSHRDGPFAAGSELATQLPITVRGLQANGYQLDKFFP